MSRIALAITLTLLLAIAGAGATPPAERLELEHPAGGHEVHVSPPALALLPDGAPLVAWLSSGHDGNAVLIARPGRPEPAVRVNPPDSPADALHQAPGLAVGSSGEVYVTWSAAKPKPPGVLFASDLYLSRSLDGGRTFEPPLRLNDDRPISHSFEDLAIAPDGTVLVGWIDSRDGPGRTATYVARLTDRGSRIQRVSRLDGGETCVCCRVSVAAGAGDRAAVLWRKVFPGDLRDMVVSRSSDGGKTFASAEVVHADRWKITACPHRGGQVALDGRGRLYATWYTEGSAGRPDVLFAVAPDGHRFGTPRRVQTATSSLPDQPRLALDVRGRGALVWEDSTAVRRRILLRSIAPGGRTLGPVRTLSTAVKAWAPAAIAVPGGVLVAWHEEQFPATRTIVMRVALEEDGR
jgi:hypothetical protein